MFDTDWEASRLLKERFEQALTTNRAVTDPRSPDPRLRGRTYAIPFDDVWNACLNLVDRNARWTLLQAEDVEGYVRVRCQTPIFRFVDDLEIRIGLDEHALTRVDVSSHSRKRRRDLGANARRIGRFLLRLDLTLRAGDSVIIDPRRLEAWSLDAG